jgi:uncharacterized protein involved in exopolysaccharide biosynthesis
MNTNALPSLTPRDVVRLLATQRKMWMAPAIVCGVLAAAYSLVMPRYWEASQALVVRQETAGSQGPTPGKFADLYEMRTMQETILELAKSQQVVVATLKAVDQRLLGGANEPTAETIEKFRGRLKMLPPDGGEFGKTEVFYFYMKDSSRERAMELVGELCRQLDTGLKELRAKRAGGLTLELQEQVTLAAEIHAQETKRLKEFETDVGADLGELRMLHSASSGQSDLRQESVQLEADVRKFETQVRESEQLLGMLRAAEKDPQQLVATPNSLLASQPALRRLKDGLVDAQLATAKLAGTRSADHPRVLSAIEAEKQIRDDLHRELVTAIRGAEAEVHLGQERVKATRARLTNLQGRLGQLAERRAEYSNRVAAVDNSRVTLDRARQNLSIAKAAQAAARSGSLVTRIDKPETGPYPAGPGRTAVTGAGAVGGLMLGLGLVFLSTGTPLSQQNTRPASTARMENALRPMAQAPLVGTRTAPPEPVERLWPEPQPAAAVATHPAPVTPQEKAAEAPKPQAPKEAVTESKQTAPSNKAIEPASIESSWASTWAPEAASEPSFASAVTYSAFREPEGETTAVAVEAAVDDIPATAKAPLATEKIERPAPAAIAAIQPAPTASIVGEQRLPPAMTPVALPAKKPSLPAPAGVLPVASGTLPALSSMPAVGGLTLQEALSAARQAQS